MALIKSISGIRGTIGGRPEDNLTPLDVVKFASAYGTWLIRQEKAPKVVLGRDARLSGKMVSDIVSATLTGLGIDVLDLGLSTTPTVEFAVPLENAGGGIILTASHNPKQWNALKLLNEKGEFVSGDDGAEILKIAEEEDFLYAEVNKLGKYSTDETYIDKHIEHILGLELVDVEAIREANFKIAIDCVNSSGGIVVPKLLNALGVRTVAEFYCDPNGHFPHNPEPLPEHLTEICGEIERGDYDLGIVVDPDVDRLAFVSNDGTCFGEEYTLVAVADYVLKHTGGSTVSNLSSTRALRDVTEKHGFTYHSSAVGEVNVVNQMKAQDAVIGGEGNGGIIYPTSHYGRDALVGIGLFLSHLAKFGKPASLMRASYPNYHISKNKIDLTPDIDMESVLKEIEKKYQSHPVSTIDGVKIEFDKEWVHLRKSNTEPIIRIYSEADSESKANHLAQKIIQDIREIISLSVDERIS